MTKVAYILTPVEFGGSEKVNLTFLKNANRERFSIHPILLVRPWEEDNYFVNKIKEMNYPISRIPVALKPRNEGRDYFRIARCLLYLYKILAKESFQIVHTHGYFADIIATPVCKFLRVPHLSTCHGFISNDRNLKIYNKLDKFALRFCEKVIAVSEEIKKDLINNGVKKSKIEVIQNAVQNLMGKIEFNDHRIQKRQFLSIRQDEFVIGYVGRLSEEKGVQYLIEAGSVLKIRDEPFKIIIIGDGPRKKELEDLAKKKGLEKKIIFTGFQNNVEEWLPILDIFVLPSLTEGTPMALLEAMSLGIPVIASAVGGVPKVVESGVSGFLVEPGDFQEMSAKIIFLKKELVLRNRMAGEAINIIKKRFDVQEWCRRIEGQYDSLTQKKV
jgi:glycosyltransferase involved in cell wall biosynthesis